MRTTSLAILTIGAITAVGGTAFSQTPGVDGQIEPIVSRNIELHLDLDRSEPEADQVVEAVDRISLWFTQSPQMGGTSIRLVPSGGEPLDLGDAKKSEGDEKLILLDVTRPLAPGTYGVYWRAMAQDGHTVRGDFSFQVKAAR